MIGLQYIRHLNYMSLTDLSKKIEVSNQFISMWEQGKKKIPQARLEKLVDIFGVSKEYFQKEISVEDEIEILENLTKIKKESFDRTTDC